MKIRDAFLSAVAGIALAATFGAALVESGAALAQTVSLNYTQRVDPDDALQVIKHGMPTAQSRFALAPQVANSAGYVKNVPLTGFSLAFATGQQNLLIVPAGTLATGTVTLAVHPAQGNLACIRSTQTQTAITISAGDTPASTITGAPTALVANTTYCLIYDTLTTTWNLWSESAG